MARGSGGDALRGISSGRTDVRAVARDVALPLVLGVIGNAVVLMAKLALGDLPRAVLKQGIGFGLETYLAFGALGGFVVGAAALAASCRRRTDRT